MMQFKVKVIMRHSAMSLRISVFVTSYPMNQNRGLIQSPVMDTGINARGGDSFNFAAAVAAFGQKLRGGTYLENFSYDDISELARQSRGNDPHGYRGEFLQLVGLAETLDQAGNVAHNMNGE